MWDGEKSRSRPITPIDGPCGMTKGLETVDAVFGVERGIRPGDIYRFWLKGWIPSTYSSWKHEGCNVQRSWLHFFCSFADLKDFQIYLFIFVLFSW